MIETRLLQQFVAVAEELHFHRAAQRLHMAQPPLSQAIRRLEQEVGHALFTRTNRSVALTPAGAAFLDTARGLLHGLDDGLARTRRVAEGLEGHLRLTFINIASYAPLLRALRSFREAAPALAFSLNEASTSEQVTALERGDADIGFMRLPGTSSPSLRFEPILRETICVALPAGHALDGAGPLALSALAGETFVASPRGLGQGYYDQLVALCQSAGFTPSIRQHARRLQTVVALVASGFGVALVPASMAQAGQDAVVFRPVVCDAPPSLQQLELLMAWDPRRQAPIRDRFIAAIRERMRPAAGGDICQVSFAPA